MKHREVFFKITSQSIALAAILLGSLVMIGWFANVGILKTVLPGLVSMKFNTAILFVLTGISMLICTSEKTERLLSWVGKVCIGFALLLAALTLFEYLFAISYGIDQFFFAEPAGAAFTSVLGRMSVVSAIGFILLNLSLLLLCLGDEKREAGAQLLAAIAGFIAYQAIVGYLFGVTELIIVRKSYTAMALHTAIGLFLLAIAVVFSRPKSGMMRLLNADSSAGRILRQVFPAILILPVIFGWLKVMADRSGIISNEMGVSMVAIANAVVFSLILWQRAAITQKMDEGRIAAESMFLQERDRANNYLEIAGMLILVVDKTGKIIYVNKKFSEVLGYQDKEVVGKSVFDMLIPETDKQNMRRLFASVINNSPNFPEYYEAERISKSGECKMIGWHVAVLKDENGQVSTVMNAGEDITAKKQVEIEQKHGTARMVKLLELSKLHHKSLKEISTYALEACVFLTESKVGFFHFFDEKSGDITLNTWSSSVMADCAVNQAQHYPLAKAGIWADCVRERKPIIVNDYQHAPNKKGYPEGHFPVKNFLSFPIFDDDKIVMVCGVGNKEADYTQHDVDELSVFMSSAWLVMKEFQADEQLKERVKDIEKQNNLMLGREMKMVELKQEVNSLLSELKRPEKYLRH